MKTISDIEKFIDSRLQRMRQVPLMFGPPQGVEGECFLLIELFIAFVLEQEIDMMSNYQSLKRDLYPDCPGPSTMCSWFMSPQYGLGLPEHDSAQKTVDFFILLKNRIKTKYMPSLI